MGALAQKIQGQNSFLTGSKLKKPAIYLEFTYIFCVILLKTQLGADFGAFPTPMDAHILNETGQTTH